MSAGHVQTVRIDGKDVLTGVGGFTFPGPSGLGFIPDENDETGGANMRLVWVTETVDADGAVEVNYSGGGTHVIPAGAIILNATGIMTVASTNAVTLDVGLLTSGDLSTEIDEDAFSNETTNTVATKFTGTVDGAATFPLVVTGASVIGVTPSDDPGTAKGTARVSVWYLVCDEPTS